MCKCDTHVKNAFQPYDKYLQNFKLLFHNSLLIILELPCTYLAIAGTVSLLGSRVINIGITDSPSLSPSTT